MQVVRHERASVKADMWSYGILVWELISNQDITNLQPLAIAQAMQVNFCLNHSSHLSYVFYFDQLCVTGKRYRCLMPLSGNAHETRMVCQRE